MEQRRLLAHEIAVPYENHKKRGGVTEQDQTSSKTISN
jgi:hypothetical protein